MKPRLYKNSIRTTDSEKFLQKWNVEIPLKSAGAKDISRRDDAPPFRLHLRKPIITFLSACLLLCCAPAFSGCDRLFLHKISSPKVRYKDFSSEIPLLESELLASIKRTNSAEEFVPGPTVNTRQLCVRLGAEPQIEAIMGNLEKTYERRRDKMLFMDSGKTRMDENDFLGYMGFGYDEKKNFIRIDVHIYKAPEEWLMDVLITYK